MKKQTLQRREDFVFSSLVGLISCLLGARARSKQARNQTHQRRETKSRWRDDSGNKLRDKEQQRLSSK